MSPFLVVIGELGTLGESGSEAAGVLGKSISTTNQNPHPIRTWEQGKLEEQGKMVFRKGKEIDTQKLLEFRP